MKDDNTHLYKMRHSGAHIMAQAVKDLFPDAQIGMGPPIESGFYYDFDCENTFTEEDLKKIEKRMRHIVAQDQKFEQEFLSKNEAIKLFSELKENYKVEIIRDITDEKVSIFKNDKFIDLCKGPHVASTREIKAFKLLNVAGAYWKGEEARPMLQRIYAAAFEKEEELKKYLRNLEEAKKRDHRRLGPKLGLFSFNEKVGAGLVIYHPKGATLKIIIEDYIKTRHVESGYEFIASPHIMKSDIWITSGHYDYYKENMYIFESDNNEFAVKPMNCPAHIIVYQSDIRSYRDLPIRFFEFGTVYRYEKSGVLHGLLRVRGFTQDDAHIFCRQDQLEGEICGVLDFAIDLLGSFGFVDYEIELSTKPEKHIGSDNEWELAEGALKEALEKKKIAFDINEGDGAFYGPKIDIKLKDAIGRTWQCATIQCDFALPERFKLKYIDDSGKEQRPIMIHRAILGSLERFIGTLIEHYAGKFPLWLAPIQCVIVPITEKHLDYAGEVAAKLKARSIRVKVDERNERMQRKIKDAQEECIPRILILGDKEASEGTVSIRYAYGDDKGKVANGVGVEELLAALEKDVTAKKLS